MNAPLLIPLCLDTPLWTMRTTLDGAEYVLKFDWNDRAQRWIFSLYDVSQNPLALGVTVHANQNPLLNLPPILPGLLAFVDTSSTTPTPPGFADLGRRVRLFYWPSTS